MLAPGAGPGLVPRRPPLFPRADNDGRQVSGYFPGVRQALRAARAHGATAQEYAAALRSLPPPAGQAAISDVLSDEVLHGMAQEQLWLDPEIFTPPIEGTAFHGLEPTRRISCPVAVLRGDPGKMAAFTADDERRFRTLNPHASVHVVPGAGHVIHADAPEEFTERLTGFLRSLK
jgi:pimeloyl-ACP methyl ester carboxylesterase